MAPRRCFQAAIVTCVVASAAASVPASAATVVNGSFETGSFSGWTVDHAGSGSWQINNGDAPNALAPTDGVRDAYTTQTAPGSQILYQDVVLEPARKHVLSFSLGYRNPAAFRTLESLEHAGGANQQFRMDVIKPTAPTRSVAASDVLALIFRTAPGLPALRAPDDVTADLSALAGQTVRLRFAVVDNLGNFFATLDKVAIASTAIDTDGDGLTDDVDNCRSVYNDDQANNDGDDWGDVCDADDDNDGVADNSPDNCVLVVNPDQADVDDDGQGTACDRVELPKSKDECKKDSWLRFHDGANRFKNQGGCVSFVSTGGRNPLTAG